MQRQPLMWDLAMSRKRERKKERKKEEREKCHLYWPPTFMPAAKGSPRTPLGPIKSPNILLKHKTRLQNCLLIETFYICLYIFYSWKNKLFQKCRMHVLKHFILWMNIIYYACHIIINDDLIFYVSSPPFFTFRFVIIC